MLKKHKLSGAQIPDQLKTIPSPPRELFVIGDLKSLLKKPRLTIVGSRKVTPYGKSVTGKFAREAAEAGIVIISGLALGVDSIAHQAVLSVGGLTVAVLPSGIDQIYPRSHTGLAREILQKNGALISEYPDKTEPFPSNFVARNRLVAGLGDAILVTEAAEKSGTLHTVNFALEQGKPVLVVPGNITSPLSAGTNNLLKSGAIPVTSIEDILDAMKITARVKSQEIIASSPEEYVILSLLKEGVTDGNDLLIKSGLAASQFNHTMTMLEITGRIKPLGNNHWTRN